MVNAWWPDPSYLQGFFSPKDVSQCIKSRVPLEIGVDPSAVGPDDHDPAGTLSGLRGSHQACGLAQWSVGQCGVFHSHAALHQSAVQLWQSLLALFAYLQTAPQGEGIVHW